MPTFLRLVQRDDRASLLLTLCDENGNEIDSGNGTKRRSGDPERDHVAVANKDIAAGLSAHGFDAKRQSDRYVGSILAAVAPGAPLFEAPDAPATFLRAGTARARFLWCNATRESRRKDLVPNLRAPLRRSK
jgi:hypothetical protein